MRHLASQHYVGETKDSYGYSTATVSTTAVPPLKHVLFRPTPWPVIGPCAHVVHVTFVVAFITPSYQPRAKVQPDNDIARSYGHFKTVNGPEAWCGFACVGVELVLCYPASTIGAVHNKCYTLFGSGNSLKPT
jgi:hypothetical protein